MLNLNSSSRSALLFAGLSLSTGLTHADHGSLGFGIGTASPIITQTGVTLPAGMWAGGLITQFYSFDSTSSAKLLRLGKTGSDTIREKVLPEQVFRIGLIFSKFSRGNG